MQSARNVLLMVMLSVSSCSNQHSIHELSPEEARKRQRKSATQLGLQTQLTNSIGMKLALIPPGQFTMGSPPHEQGRRDVETPHLVTVTKAFYLGTTEVTQQQWKALMGENPSFFEGDDLPVETITWAQAVEFCEKLSEKEGLRYRLPSEAEWEYACRAGTVTAFHTGVTISTDLANYNGESSYGGGDKGLYRDETTEAGSFPPNAWGLHDMHGNVWEWCADWFGDYPVGAATDPTGPADGTTRVVRGGCWINTPAVCRAANRGDTVPESWNFHFGFRIVRNVD